MEMPLRLIAPVLALPGSTYFSNYEVFIAERRIGKGQSQFIKLVYTSLPYQRRLAEYGPNYSMGLQASRYQGQGLRREPLANDMA